jgi:acyl carrier protein
MVRLLTLLNDTIGKQLTKPIHEIDKDENLFQMGLNSIGFISLIIEIEKCFGIHIEQDDLDLENFNTVNKIKNVIDKKVVSLNEI